MYGRTGSEDSVLSFVIQWVGIALSNFTVGMISAVLSFMFALPGLIWSYGANIFSGALFFLIASVAASSVVTTYLGALYGTAAVGTYYAIKVRASAPTGTSLPRMLTVSRRARLPSQASGAQPRVAYSRQHRRYQVTQGRRPHTE